MESCELHLILQPLGLLEMSLYALNCTGIKDGNVTPMSLPREPQYHLTNCLYAMCLLFLGSDSSYAETPYCCLYCHAARNTQ